VTENDMLTVAAVSASAAWLAWRIVKASLAYRSTQRAADRKAQADQRKTGLDALKATQP
jgi:hypothetical protein